MAKNFSNSNNARRKSFTPGGIQATLSDVQPSWGEIQTTQGDELQTWLFTNWYFYRLQQQ